MKYIFKLSHVTTVTYNAQSGKNAKITQDFSHRQQALFPHIQQNHSIEPRPNMNMPESVQSTILVPDTSLNLDVKPEMYVN